MEIYNFYRIATMLSSLFGDWIGDKNIPIYGAVIGVLLFALVFILQGVGISTMAKRRGIDKRWLAFVPFVNIWYVGKLAGDCQFFGQKMKRAGLYAMIGQIVATLVTCAMIASEVYLWTMHGSPDLTTGVWHGLSGFSLTVFNFYDISLYIVSIAQLVCEILFFILLTSLYKQYEPKNYFILSLLTLLVPLARFFIIFALRNRRAIDYEAYMRARQEAYARRRQQYSNPYNNPYGNGGYNQSPYGQNAGATQPKPEEPFAEFSSDFGGNSTSKADGDSDGFFD